ncbi:Disease resistance-like protein [Nymphaea thermarum]|nr:Disease resistance-like protein [Nymphaea thermarum]
MEELEETRRQGKGGAINSFTVFTNGDGSEFEAFLSFRGENTRKCFIGHLYEGLEEHGISTVIDSGKLVKREDIEKLFEYTETIKIFVPILSKHFAESKRCLKEVDVLRMLLRQFSTNQNVNGGIRGNMEVGEGMEPLTPSPSSPRVVDLSLKCFSALEAKTPESVSLDIFMRASRSMVFPPS